MRLLIDLGNTRAKWAWQAHAAAPLEGPQNAAHDGGRCQRLLDAIGRASVDQIWLSSVAGDAANRLQDAIRKICLAKFVRALSPTQLGGVRNAYAEPERLGVDRFLAMLGARSRYPSEALLVVDAGTALTIDLLAADGQHRGGSIAPGLRLMRHCLGSGTATLGTRTLPPTVAIEQLGATTANAIECGILGAACGAVALRMDQHSTLRPRLLITGGDAPALVACFSKAQELPLLVLEGLARYAGCLQNAD